MQLKEKENWMQKALLLAEKGRLSAPPNPWVGCIIIEKDRILGEGYHRKKGGPHAEAVAIKEAQAKKRDLSQAKLFCTLEPCSHFGQTPPCAQAIIDSGIKVVYIAILDPDPKVQGKGKQMLINAGIEVDCGILEEKVSYSLRAYLKQRKTKRPFCIMKAATSIDGKIAAFDKSSKWLSCKAARKDAHRLRAESQAILVASGTALADLPQLTVRDIADQDFTQPLRVLLDRKGSVKQGPLLDTTLAPTLIVGPKQAGCEQLPSDTSLHELFEELAKRGVLQLLIEGGAHTYQKLLNEDLIDEITLYLSPKILGHKGLSLFPHSSIENCQEGPRLRLLQEKRLENTMRLDYQVLPKLK